MLGLLGAADWDFQGNLPKWKLLALVWTQLAVRSLTAGKPLPNFAHWSLCCCKCSWAQWCHGNQSKPGCAALCRCVVLRISMGSWVLGFIHGSAKLPVRETLCWNIREHWEREGDATVFIFCRAGNICPSDNEQLGEVQLCIATAVCLVSTSQNLQSPAML